MEHIFYVIGKVVVDLALLYLAGVAITFNMLALRKYLLKDEKQIGRPLKYSDITAIAFATSWLYVFDVVLTLAYKIIRFLFRRK